MPGKMRKGSGEQDFLRKNRKFLTDIAQRNAEKFFYYN